jgi:PHD/YefM family antitoxin component YafN of YafNO toxin-antitoxin module
LGFLRHPNLQANPKIWKAIEMMSIHKKIVIDEHGNPHEVIIPWDQFQEIVEILGLDLDSEALEDLRQAREDRESGKRDAYISLDSI